jgi:hypothetical protein
LLGSHHNQSFNTTSLIHQISRNDST